MSNTITRECPSCHEEFEARKSDVKRGWGKFCSKTCKAKVQTKRNRKSSKFDNLEHHPMESGYFGHGQN